MPDHNYFSNLIWQIADLLRGPYRPPQYERVMLPMTVLRRFDCVLEFLDGIGQDRRRRPIEAHRPHEPLHEAFQLPLVLFTPVERP